MRKLLLASAAILGATGGLAMAQTPANPSQGQLAAPYAGGPTIANFNNATGSLQTRVGSASAGPISTNLGMSKGVYAIPAPGTVAIRLNGRVEADYGYLATSLDHNSVAGGTYKLNNNYIASYMRLYPGFDGMSTNGIRYGAQIELRENFQSALLAGSTAAAPNPSSPSLNSSASTVFVRRAYTYLASDQLGIVRLGQADGVVGLFDPCTFASQCWDAGVGVFQGSFYAFAPSNLGGAATNYPWLTQAGAEYDNNKIVYLTPQLFGFDLGFQYAPSEGNAYQNTTPNVGIAGSLPTSIVSDAQTNTTTGQTSNRWYNQAGVGIRYQGDFGPIDVKAYGYYEHAAGENAFAYSAVPVGSVAFRGVSTNAMRYDPLSFFQAGLAVTSAGLTAAVDFIGGRVNNQLALDPKGAPDERATVVGLTYFNGPWTAGIATGFIDAQGSNNLTGFSQRHQFETSLGGNYKLAPGVNLVLEYAYYQSHQGGFNFATNAATGTSVGNNLRGQGLTFSTVLTW